MRRFLFSLLGLLSTLPAFAWTQYTCGFIPGNSSPYNMRRQCFYGTDVQDYQLFYLMDAKCHWKDDIWPLQTEGDVSIYAWQLPNDGGGFHLTYNGPHCPEAWIPHYWNPKLRLKNKNPNQWGPWVDGPEEGRILNVSAPC